MLSSYEHLLETVRQYHKDIKAECDVQEEREQRFELQHAEHLGKSPGQQSTHAQPAPEFDFQEMNSALKEAANMAA